MISHAHAVIMYDVKYTVFNMYGGFTFVNRKMEILFSKETRPGETSGIVEIFTYLFFALMKINFYNKS